MKVGDILQLRAGALVEVQEIDNLFVAFTYGGKQTYFLGREEFHRRFGPTSPSVEDRTYVRILRWSIPNEVRTVLYADHTGLCTRAETPVGIWTVESTDGNKTYHVAGGRGAKQNRTFATIEEAKAAAQAEFEETVIECLSLRPRDAAQRVGDAIYEVMAERDRQVFIEGWSTEHDDTHDKFELAQAGAAYAEHASRPDATRAHLEGQLAKANGPNGGSWFKPKDRRRDLVRAAALLVAEIERLDRAQAKASVASQGSEATR